MEDTEIKRKLATILVADIVGYSRLTANDEDWTIRALADFRRIVDEIIERHDGRIFNTGGDSILAEFASPVEAVRAAVDFQEAARSRNLLQPRDRQLRFRIGLNLGDVMVRGHDLLGDGVNVAARLEGIAEPGGICVSGTVWDHINGKLSIGYVDIGEQSVKNIPRPIRAYHLRVDGGSDEIAAGTAHPVAPARPAPAAAPRQRGVVGVLIGAGVVIVALAGVVVWQFWPKSGAPAGPVATATPPAPPAPAAPATSPFQTALSARLAVLVPAMSEKARDDHAHSYVTGQTHKAIAVPPGVNGNWQAKNRGSIENATDSSLENCQLYYNQPCVLAAADDALQPMPAEGKPAPRDMPRLNYAGNFDPAQIPGVPQPVRERSDAVGYASAPSPKAAAFHSGGGWFFAVTGAADQHAAEVGALKACTDDIARQPAGGSSSCYLYAAENRVVLPQRLKAPMTAALAAAPLATAPPVSAPAPAPTPPPVLAPAPKPAPVPSASAAPPPKTFRDCPNCPEMIVVPAGSFQMGALPGEHDRLKVPAAEAARDEPRHAVTIAKPFALGKYDVTRAEFAAFAKAAGFHPLKGCQTFAANGWQRQDQASWDEPGFAQTERDPVVCINAADADAYLAWLRRTTGKAYRLPTEAEWEYAARAGTTTSYYWGDDPNQVCGYENTGDETFRHKHTINVPEAAACNDGFSETAPVGSFKPNPFGLHDMIGNNFVLTADCWNETYTGAPADGSAWTTGDCNRRVARKSSFGSVRPFFFRAAQRVPEMAAAKRDRVGFRVALSLD